MVENMDGKDLMKLDDNAPVVAGVTPTALLLSDDVIKQLKPNQLKVRAEEGLRIEAKRYIRTKINALGAGATKSYGWINGKNNRAEWS